MACWDIVGKAVGKPVYELLGGRVHERLRAYTYLYRRARRHGRRLHAIPSSPPSARPPMSTQGSRRSSSIRPGRTPPSTRASRAWRTSIAPSATSRRSARPSGLALRPAVRHARPVHRRRRDPPGAAARALRSAVVRGAGAAGHARGDGDGRARDVDPDRHRRAADDEIRVRPRARRRAPPRSCRRTSAASAGCSRPRRSPAWPRRTTRRSRRTCTAGPSSAPPTSSSRPARRTS